MSEKRQSVQKLVQTAFFYRAAAGLKRAAV